MTRKLASPILNAHVVAAHRTCVIPDPQDIATAFQWAILGIRGARLPGYCSSDPVCNGGFKIVQIHSWRSSGPRGDRRPRMDGQVA